MNDRSEENAIRWKGSGLYKSYSVPVLEGIDLELRSGSVLALLGANGAGKSTLGKMIAGLVRPDQGNMWLNDSPYAPSDQKQAQSQGVHIVLQELNLFDTLSVSENLFLGHLPHRLGWINRQQLRDQAHQALQRVGLEKIHPDQSVKSLGVGERQLLEIARALAQQCRVLVLDEPTAALTAPQVDKLFEQIHALRSRGVAMVYVSHRLKEIEKIADDVVILRDGKLIEQGPVSQFDIDRAVAAMSGRAEAPKPQLESTQIVSSKSDFHHSNSVRPFGETVLSVEGLSIQPRVTKFDLTVRAGEILGIAGLVGSGRTEALRAVFGIDQADEGIIRLAGRDSTSLFRSPREAIHSGIVMVPEDRKTQGLLLSRSIVENTTLGAWGKTVAKWSWIVDRLEAQAATETLEPFDVKCDSLQQPIEELSGGNQQKVLVARSTRHTPRVLLIDEPTRGIDVDAKRLLHNRLKSWASKGCAIVVVSSDLAELLELCDTLCVMHDGKTRGTFPASDFDELGLLQAALGQSIKDRLEQDKTS